MAGLALVADGVILPPISLGHRTMMLRSYLVKRSPSQGRCIGPSESAIPPDRFESNLLHDSYISQGETH